jgi:EF-P beta-lysylation protein EpmB
MHILAENRRGANRAHAGADQPTWHRILKTAIRDPAELGRRLNLPRDVVEGASAAGRDFPLFVPAPYLARIEPGNPDDPLLLQVLPTPEERIVAADDRLDPVDDAAARQSPGVLHKYHGRALVIASGTCAVNCRYCFRRHYPYDDRPTSDAEWDAAIHQLARQAKVDEVILSGGDPLVLVDERLAAIIDRLAQLPQVRRVRIHTRLPIVIPQRVTSSLIAALTATRLQPIVVVHANHPREIDPTTVRALARLARAGIMLLNQSVLLRRVNDDAATLAELSQRLIECRVVPYYLHQLDPVAGARHFAVPIERGRQIIAELRGRLPGYAVPRYVQEIAGQPSKCVLA